MDVPANIDLLFILIPEALDLLIKIFDPVNLIIFTHHNSSGHPSLRSGNPLAIIPSRITPVN